jgi:predicted HTH transcriptional regulator
MSSLHEYIKEGEHESQDFKFRIDDQKKIARTLSAFANTVGGRLLIGVKDNGKVVGVDPQEEFYMIEGAASLFVSHRWNSLLRSGKKIIKLSWK